MIILFFIVFLVFLIFVVLPLGDILLSNFNLSLPALDLIILSLVFGLVFITLESYILSIINLYYYFYIFFIIQSLACLFYFCKKKSYKKYFSIQKINPLVFFVVLLSTVVNSLMTFNFGIPTSKGISLTGAHFIDNTWHLALINSLEKSIPPENPVFAGTVVTGYHYFVDLLISNIQRLTFIPLPQLYFQIIGPFFFLLFSIIIFIFIRRITKNNFCGVLGILFICLSSNWYYLASLFYSNVTSNPSIAWIDYFSSKDVNYPLIFSEVVMFQIIYILNEKRSYRWNEILILSLTIGSLIVFKIHTAIILVSAVSIIGLFEAFKKRFQLLVILFFSGIFSIFLFINVIGISQNRLIIYPFWFIKTMYEAGDRLNNSDWELKRQFLLSFNNYFAVARLYGLGILVFLGINLGGLLIIFLALVRKNKYENETIKSLFLLIFFFSFIYTMVFISSGVAITTIQFFYTCILSSAILFIMIGIDYIKFRKSIFILSMILWISFLPGVFYNLNYYHISNINYDISPNTLNAMQYLSKYKKGTILLSPDLTESSLVSAYTAMPVYYSSEIILSSNGVDLSERKKNTSLFFGCTDNNFNQNMILLNNISYIFSKGDFSCLDSFKYVKLFDNEEIKIYSVN